MRLGLAAVILVLIFSLPLLASSREQRTRGAALFVSSGCEHCHTIGAVGGHRGPNLSNIGRTAKVAAIRKQIVAGSDVMPEFGDVLQPQEINDLIAYLHSCRTKPSK
jgi:mono/diheme cytochrome c family protein